MNKTTFGQRLKLAFKDVSNAEIARQIGVSRAAVVNYVAGRVPDLDKLEKIKTSTNCDLDWLLTGDESRNVHALRINPVLEGRLRTIAHEQAQTVFADAEIAAGNVDERTFNLLVEYLLYRALVSFNLIAENDMLTATDRKRAKRFTFVNNAAITLDDHIRRIVDDMLVKSKDEIGGEVGDIKPANMIFASHWGTVDGGEEETEEAPKLRRKS